MKIRIKQLSLILICCCIVQISFAQKKEKKVSKAKDKTENIKVRPAVEKTRQVELKNLAYWLISLQITPSISSDYTELFTGRIDEKYVTNDESVVFLKNMYGHTLYKINLKYNGKYPLSGNIYKSIKSNKKYHCSNTCRFQLEYDKNNLLNKIKYINETQPNTSKDYIFRYNSENKEIASIDLKTSNNKIVRKAHITNNLIDTLFKYNNSLDEGYNNYLIYRYNDLQKVTLIEKYDQKEQIHSSTYIKYDIDTITPLYLINSGRTSPIEKRTKYKQDIYKYTQVQNQTIQVALNYLTRYTNNIDEFDFLDILYLLSDPIRITYKYNTKNECTSIFSKLDFQPNSKLINFYYTIDEDGFIINEEQESKSIIRYRD